MTLHPVQPVYIPQDVDMTAVKAQVAATGVSAPAADMPGLLHIVDEAHAKGINLKIVLLDHNPRTTPAARHLHGGRRRLPRRHRPDAEPELRRELQHPVPRVTLEAGEDIAKTGNPVVSAQHFLNELDSPEFPWTGLTIFLLLAVLAAAVGTRFLQLRSRRLATPADSAGAQEVTPTNTA